jgi:hypothetical protein
MTIDTGSSPCIATAVRKITGNCALFADSITVTGTDYYTRIHQQKQQQGNKMLFSDPWQQAAHLFCRFIK